MKAYEKAEHLCKEFTDDVLYDSTRYSLVVNVDKKFFRLVKKELEKLGYVLYFTKTFKDINTITCSFKLVVFN